MKKLLVLFVLVLLIGCKKEPQPTVLNLAITQQPNGGYNVQTLTCTFTGNLSGDVKPITVTAEWWWENGLHTGATLKNSNSYAVSSSSSVAFTTTYTATPGYYFLNYLWVKLRWTDDTGAHTMETNKAYCN